MEREQARLVVCKPTDLFITDQQSEIELMRLWLNEHGLGL
jgi:hypothetical protein